MLLYFIRNIPKEILFIKYSLGFVRVMGLQKINTVMNDVKHITAA